MGRRELKGIPLIQVMALLKTYDAKMRDGLAQRGIPPFIYRASRIVRATGINLLVMMRMNATIV